MALKLFLLIISGSFADFYTCDDGTEIESGNSSFKPEIERTSVFDSMSLN